MTSQILTIHRILEGVRAKKIEATILFVDFSKAFDSIRKGKILFTNPSARAGYDTRSNFKRSLTGFNSEFSFS